MILLSERLARVLDPAAPATAVRLLAEYFTPRPAGKFTGAHFERLGGGGDRPEVANCFTAEDLIAVSMLSVSVEGDAALEVLEHRAARLSALLSGIDRDVTFACLKPTEIETAWPVRALLKELLSIRDIGETTATKLLARKRPHLVPILDSVVTKELSIVGGRLWAPLHGWLTANGGANHAHLKSLREASGIGEDISTLRVFDVLTWRVGKGHVPDAAQAT